MSNKIKNSKKKSNSAIADNVDTKKRTSLLVFPFTVSLVLSVYLFKGISLTHPRYGTRTILAAGLILLFWTFVFIADQLRIYKGKGKYFIRCHVLPIFVMAVFIAMFMACAVWGAGYLSLVPYERIDNGSQHIDSMYHSAIAESYKHFPYASTLLNGEEYLPYHTFSHMLMGNVSRILGIPGLVAYCFFFPTIFLPLYVLTIMFAISCAKNYFEGKLGIAFLDVAVVSLFISGVAASSVIGSYGVWKTSYILSESFEIADTLTFLAYGVAFYAVKEWQDNKKRLNLFKFFLMPVFIFIISWSKISVGFVFTTSVLYYVFRTRMKEWRYWLLNIFYFAVFIVSLRLFNSNVSNASIADTFKFKAFEEYCSGPLGIWGHYLILLIMPVMFITLEVARNHYDKKDFFAAKTVWIEDMIVVCLVAFLPGFVMIIAGGSAAYFSYVCEIPALLMLCGRNYVDLNEDVKGSMRPLIYAFCFCWCIFTAYTNRSASPLDAITGEHTTNLSGTLLGIRDAVGNDADKYSIYLDQDSIVTQVFASGMTSSYVCPAMTGVGVINASYYQDGACYSYLGEQLSNEYAMTFTDNEGMLSFEDAIEKARGMGKEALIHITNSGYEVVKID